MVFIYICFLRSILVFSVTQGRGISADGKFFICAYFATRGFWDCKENFLEEILFGIERVY
ncbi:hypothetical protein CW304_04310 [Bacillus sp. UFRGS-B20]|nr:hypothetical protein CW304_04310 [Bacillus sp. UFRGS-B20]